MRRGSFAGSVRKLPTGTETFSVVSTLLTCDLSAAFAPTTGQFKSTDVHVLYFTRMVLPKDALFMHMAAPDGRPLLWAA